MSSGVVRTNPVIQLTQEFANLQLARFDLPGLAAAKRWFIRLIQWLGAESNC